MLRIMVVDDSQEIRKTVVEMLEMEPEFKVIGQAQDGYEALRLGVKLEPDVVILDINLPGLDGISVADELIRKIKTTVIMISVEGEREYFRKAMNAGASDFLVKPFGQKELSAAIWQAVQKRDSTVDLSTGAVVTVLGSKGGTGKTTMAVNLATAIGQQLNSSVGLLDLDLELGTLSSSLGLRSQTTLIDLCQQKEEITKESLEKVWQKPERLPLRVLTAPLEIHMAAEVDGEGKKNPHRNYVAEILGSFRKALPLTVVDTGNGFREATVTAIEGADLVVLVTTPEIPALENTMRILDLLIKQLSYPEEKIKLVLNRADSLSGLTPDEISHSLDFGVWHSVSSDYAVAAQALNVGVPLVSRRGRSQLAFDLESLAHKVIAEIPVLKAGKKEEQPKGRFRLFGGVAGV